MKKAVAAIANPDTPTANGIAFLATGSRLVRYCRETEVKLGVKVGRVLLSAKKLIYRFN
jgi:hypothetical protein